MSKADDLGSKVCVKCGVKKDISAFGVHSPGFRRADCLVCSRVRGAKYHAANKDAINTKKAKAREGNEEYHRERGRRYYQENHAERLAKNAEWRAANLGRLRQATAAWRVRHPDRQKAAEAAWRAANPWIARVVSANRRARKLATQGIVSSGIVAKLFALQRGRCACCGEKLGSKYHLDHVMPLALGGAHDDSNLQLLRAVCNLRKGAKHPVEYMQQRGLLI
ncbi:HNH endonuclease [Oxalobacteraceae sp. CFBP 8755]|nr:HNH endonuclease [Oxalobacteraceae sp. CFBP 8755]